MDSRNFSLESNGISIGILGFGNLPLLVVQGRTGRN